MVLRLGWEEKGYPMVIPCSGKRKLRIAMYSKTEESEWEASLGVFESDQKEFMKETLKGKSGKIGMKAGTYKEMYWVGLVPYYMQIVAEFLSRWTSKVMQMNTTRNIECLWGAEMSWLAEVYVAMRFLNIKRYWVFVSNKGFCNH